jgi:hypothetical protein
VTVKITLPSFLAIAGDWMLQGERQLSEKAIGPDQLKKTVAPAKGASLPLWITMLAVAIQFLPLLAALPSMSPTCRLGVPPPEPTVMVTSPGALPPLPSRAR